MIPETGWGKARICSMYLPPVTKSTARNTSVEIGPVQVGDLSGGLRSATWNIQVTDDFNVIISADDFETQVALFTERGISNVSFTFNVEGYPVIAYELHGCVVIRQYNNGVYEATKLGIGSRPKVHLDLRSLGTESISDVVVAYTNGDKVYTRSMKDGWNEVYTGIRVPIGSFIQSFGMTIDHRMQLSIVEAAARRPNGSIIAIGHENDPYISMYKRDGDQFVRLSNVNPIPAGTVRSVSFSPDGQFFAVAHDFAPYLTLYRKNDDGTSFSRMIGLSGSRLNSAGRGVTYSPDGVFVCAIESTRPYITLFKQRGERLLKMGSPSYVLPGLPYGAAFSPDGQSLTVVHASPPYVTVFSLNSSNWLGKLPDPSHQVPGVGRGLSFSPTGDMIAVTHNLYPFVTVYTTQDGTLTTTIPIEHPPSDTAIAAAFSPNGKFLAVGGFGVPYINVYSVEGGYISALPLPSSIPTGPVRGVTFDASNDVLMLAHQTFPFFTAYKIVDGRLIKQPLISPSPSNNAMAIAAF